MFDIEPPKSRTNSVFESFFPDGKPMFIVGPTHCLFFFVNKMDHTNCYTLSTILIQSGTNYLDPTALCSFFNVIY